jgi:two-component system chemotaxis response regulator CheB
MIALCQMDDILAFVSDSEHNTVSAPAPEACAVVVIALSAGGLWPLRQLVKRLALDLPAAVVVAQHVHDFTMLPTLLAFDTRMPVEFAASGTTLTPGRIFVCPAQQHIIVNPDATLTLSDRGRLSFFRPNGDWLFESAAASFREHTVAVVLSGSQRDAAQGVKYVRAAGGTVIVQDPRTCEYPGMPAAAIATGAVRHVLDPQDIAAAINNTAAAFDVATYRSRWVDPFNAGYMTNVPDAYGGV